MTVRFFASKEALREWFEVNAGSEPDIILGFYKKGASKQGVAYDDAVIEGLRFGWIDSITRRIDDERYSIRFTPRRPNSNWTDRNCARVEEMIANDDIHPLGIAAYERRRRVESGEQSVERKRSSQMAGRALKNPADRAKNAEWH